MRSSRPDHSYGVPTWTHSGVCTSLVGMAESPCWSSCPSLPVAMVVLGAVGFLFSIALASFIPLIQLSAEDRVMGRVMSLCTMTVAAGLLISLVWGGALADLLGVRQVIGAGAGCIGLCGGLTFLLVRQTPASPGPDAAEAGVPKFALLAALV